MGFVLTETDYHLLSLEKKQGYWSQLPICQAQKGKVAGNPAAVVNDDAELNKYRQVSLKSLGRLFSSL